MTWLVQRMAESPWGAFALAQCRIECRSGLRPRGFLRGGVVDNEAAAHRARVALGLCARDRASSASRAATTRSARASQLAGAADPRASRCATRAARNADAHYVASMHLAQTPRGLRLVQVDPDFDLERAERGGRSSTGFEAEAWGCAGSRPSAPISASFTSPT